MARSQTGSRGLAAVALAAVAIGILLVAGQLLVSSYQGLDYRCYVEGPTPSFVSAESAVADGSISILPLGRACTWTQGGSSATVTRAGDWVATILPAALFLVAAVSAVVVMMAARGRRTM